MPTLAFEVILVSIILLWLPALAMARGLARKGDATATRRLLFILPAQLPTGTALLFGIDALVVDEPDELVITASSMLGIAGALLCLMCHQIAQI